MKHDENDLLSAAEKYAELLREIRRDLHRHPEIYSQLSRQGTRRFCVTRTSPSALAVASRLIPDIEVAEISLD